MRSFLVAFVLLSITVAAAPAPATVRAPANLSPFSMVITSTATGWTAHCDSGCQWTDLAFTCGASCNTLVDEYGVSPTTMPSVNRSAFAFVFTPTDSGPRAVARHGTSWQAVSWHCDRAPCRARLNESGVAVVRP